MITVKSIKEAWKVADKLYPTDYMKDEKASANAGYPIYMSTVEGNGSWISDLNTSLELNIQKGKKLETVRIVIEDEPEITEERSSRLIQSEGVASSTTFIPKGLAGTMTSC